MDSIDPPGGRRITVSDDAGVVLLRQLPQRFDIAPGRDRAAGRLGARRRRRSGDPCGIAMLTSAARLPSRPDLRGRFLHDLTTRAGGRTDNLDFDSPGPDQQRLLHSRRRRSRPRPAPASTRHRSRMWVRSPPPAPGRRPHRLSPDRDLHPAPGAIAGRVPGPRPRTPDPRCCWSAALAIAAVAISGWVAYGVLEALPHTPDEVVYLLQADWLLDGNSGRRSCRTRTTISVPFTYTDGERWLAHYPPGWPALLAVGVAAGIPWRSRRCSEASTLCCSTSPGASSRARPSASWPRPSPSFLRWLG